MTDLFMAGKCLRIRITENISVMSCCMAAISRAITIHHNPGLHRILTAHSLANKSYDCTWFNNPNNLL